MLISLVSTAEGGSEKQLPPRLRAAISGEMSDEREAAWLSWLNVYKARWVKVRASLFGELTAGGIMTSS